MDYYQADELKHMRDLREAAPTEFEAWLGLEKSVGRKDGAIPNKYRQLIAIACAHVTQCPHCIDGHIKAAHREGASKTEIAEAIFIAAGLRAGAAATHGAMAMKMLAELDDKAPGSAAC